MTLQDAEARNLHLPLQYFFSGSCSYHYILPLAFFFPSSPLIPACQAVEWLSFSKVCGKPSQSKYTMKGYVICPLFMQVRSIFYQVVPISEYQPLRYQKKVEELLHKHGWLWANAVSSVIIMSQTAINQQYHFQMILHAGTL